MLPLEKVRVVDLTIYQQGPFATKILADMGAEVIKIEPRGTGDPGRGMGSKGIKGLSTYHEAQNRGKKSVTVDVRTEKGKDIIYKLVEKADIFAQNFRPGVAARLGFSYEQLSKINPKIIYLSGSAFGLKGPLAEKPGLDTVGQAMSGIMSVTGSAGALPTRVGVSIADQTGAYQLAMGAVVALFHRERTGEGQEVDASLLGSAINLLGWTMQTYLLTGNIPGRTRGRILPGVFVATFIDKNGKYFIIQANGPGKREAAFAALGQEALLTDPRFDTVENLLKNEAKLFTIFDGIFATKSREEWLEILDKADIVAAPVYDFEEASKQPQAIANKYIVEVDHPLAGKIRVHGFPISFSKTPQQAGIAPAIGEHTDSVLKDLLGFSRDQITQLRQEKVI